MRLERIAYPSSAGMTVTYDALTGRPDSIAQNQGTAELARFDYGFDADGKILSIADPGGTRDFAYDATLQLTGGGYASNPESYSYDAEGNRTASHLSAGYVHDTTNRLREDAETCYDYDANGNMVSKTAKVAGACTGAVTAYSWDVLNRLVRIDNPDGSFAAYRYDAQGRRIGKDVNGALTRYVYDDDAILLEYDGGGALQATYSHGEEVDQPLAMARGGGSYFYHADHLGSVRLLTDAAGAVVSRYDYDAFGNLEATGFEGVANPFTFTARERDAESGLMFYRARYYDPRIGRFVTEDPLGFGAGDLNIFRYALNEPVRFSDPSGLEAEEEGKLYQNAADTADVLHELSGVVNCGFFTLGSIMGAINTYMTMGGGGTLILGLDPNACGVSAEMTPMMKGIKAHDAFNAAAKGSGYRVNRRVFDGSALRPDLAHRPTESCVEMKPLTKSGVKSMRRKTFRYTTSFRRLASTAARAFSNTWECLKVFYYWAE